MNTLEAIKKRRSIRKFKKGALVPDEDIKQILEAAMLAPSAKNCRPWEFVVIRNREMMAKLPEISPYIRMMDTASLAIVVCGLPEDQKGKCDEYWPEDCGAAIENMLLAALELGYGTCWCGIYPSEGRSEAMKELIGVSSVPMAVIAVGVADEDPAQRGHYEESKVRFID